MFYDDDDMLPYQLQFFLGLGIKKYIEDYEKGIPY